MKLTNKQIGAQLLLIASQPLGGFEDGRFEVTLDGLTIRCKNTRESIEAVAAKFHKGLKLKTVQKFAPTVSTRRESGKAMLKRLKLEADEDYNMFDALLANRSAKEIATVSLI